MMRQHKRSREGARQGGLTASWPADHQDSLHRDTVIVVWLMQQTGTLPAEPISTISGERSHDAQPSAKATTTPESDIDFEMISGASGVARANLAAFGPGLQKNQVTGLTSDGREGRPVVVSDAGRIDGELIQRLLSQRVTGYEPLSGFAANTVAAVTLESGARAVFKAAGKREVEVELWALRSMSERGIPVPDVIAGDPDAEVPYLVTRLVSGEPGVATLQAASEVGRLLCAVHAMPVKGAGFFKESSGAPPYAHEGTWADQVAALTDRLAPVADAGILTPTLHARCRDLLLDGTRWDQPCVYVHGDFHPRHVLSAGSRIEGIIDWADCGAASPWLDLARVDFREPGLQRAMLDAYFPAGVPADARSHLANHRHVPLHAWVRAGSTPPAPR
ncbi:phosphotransferase [Nonomuraea phyllanthi]|nr:aminoglycoside phosphotransferase family protein [Nonomuraea phyllanthi]QFY08641.1 phosphotransferase [Nonomuraea phyllanthi]